MSGRIKALADDEPGYATLIIGNSAGISDPHLRIRRDGWTKGILGPQGWQIGDALLPAQVVDVSGGNLVLKVGPEVTQHLESATYLIAVPEAGIGEQAVFWPEVVPLLATGRRRVLVGKAPSRLAEPEPQRPSARAAGLAQEDPALRAEQPEAVAQLRQAKPASQPPLLEPARKPQSRLWLLIAGGIVAVLLIGGGLAALLHQRMVQTARATAPTPAKAALASAKPPPPEAKSTALAAPPSLGSLSVNQVITQAPNAAAVFAEGERRLQGKRKDQGLLLVEAAADKGSPAAMLALARLYDPVGFNQQGPIPQPDMRESAEYFRRAVQAESTEAVAPRAALHAYLRSAAQHGDLEAKLTLQDFWP